MRRVLSTFLPVLFLVVSMIPSIAKADTGYVIDARFLKIKIIVDGKPQQASMVVNLTVFYDKRLGDKWATWDSVYIMPETPTGGEKVVLRADHYETKDLPFLVGIRNLVVTKNKATFDLYRSSSRPVHIVCVKRDADDFDLRGTSTYYSDILKKTMTEEWVLTDKIILPSKEVYGFPK